MVSAMYGTEFYISHLDFVFLGSSCELEKKIALQIKDSFVPECNEDGGYRDKQCFSQAAATKQCWCVDREGKEIKGTRNSADKVDCGESSPRGKLPIIVIQ